MSRLRWTEAEIAQIKASGMAASATRRKTPRQLEHQQQCVFINRIRAIAANQHGACERAVARTYAIPNGGARSKLAGRKLKLEGVKPGVSDLFVSLPMGAFHGLYIEMKTATGRVSPEQRAWLEDSRALGYGAVVCRGPDEAVVAWLRYVEAGLAEAET